MVWCSHCPMSSDWRCQWPGLFETTLQESCVTDNCSISPKKRNWYSYDIENWFPWFSKSAVQQCWVSMFLASVLSFKKITYRLDYRHLFHNWTCYSQFIMYNIPGNAYTIIHKMTLLTITTPVMLLKYMLTLYNKIIPMAFISLSLISLQWFITKRKHKFLWIS